MPRPAASRILWSVGLACALAAAGCADEGEPGGAPSVRMAAEPEGGESGVEGAAGSAEQSPDAAALLNEALQLTAGLVRRWPDDPRSHYLEGLARRQAAQTERAEAAWRRCVALDPTFAAAYYWLGVTAQSRGDSATAAEMLARAASLNPAAGRWAVELAEALMAQRRLEAALRVLQQHLAAFPESLAACELAGQVCVQLKRRREAIDYFERALELAPDYSPVHYAIAAAYAAEGRADEAKRHFERYRQLRADEGRSIRREMEAFHDVAALKQFVASLHASAAELFAAYGDETGAERSWRRAVALHPDEVEHRRDLAGWLQERGRWEEAAGVWRELLAQDPDSSAAHMALGVLRFQQRRFAEAEAELREVIRLEPDLAVGYATLAKIHLTAGDDPAAARRLAERAAALEPAAEHFALLGAACEAAGDRPAALDAWRQAAAREPGNPQYAAAAARLGGQEP